jgi:hypothetical protein
MAVNVATKSQARLFAQLISTLEPEVKRAFMASVVDLQAGVNWPLLLQRLEAGDIDGAVAALNISAAAWAEYSSVMTAAYARAGASTMAQIRMVGIAPVGVRFDMANPRAERWIRQNVAEMVVGFANEQIEVARNVIGAGYARGDGPRTIAIELGGRVTNGTRQGGVLGLDAPRAARLEKVSVGMRTPEGVQSLVIKREDGTLAMRYKVNPATEKRILSAYNAGTAVPDDARAISERQYRNALLQARADTVAATETGNAVLNSRDEAFRQTMEQQGIRPDQVVKRWRHGGGPTAHHRPDHYAMGGTDVVGMDAPFVFPDGTAMLFPHDPAGGARHNINCRCSVEYKVNYEVD